jgi:hypothetical protein
MLRLITRSIFVAGILLAGCTTTTSHRSGGGGGGTFAFDSLPAREQGVYLTIIHRMFAHCDARAAGSSIKLYLSCNDQDPGSDLLSHLQAEGCRVSPGSEYQEGRGIQCTLGRIERTSAEGVKVYGGYLYGTDDGAWGYFYLKEVDGRWMIVTWEVDSVQSPAPKKIVPEVKEVKPPPKSATPAPKKEGAAPAAEPKKEGSPESKGEAAPAEPKKEGAAPADGAAPAEPKKDATPAPAEGAAPAEPKKDAAPAEGAAPAAEPKKDATP